MKITLTDEYLITPTGEKVYRIKAIQDIPSKGIRVGDLGGYISSLYLEDGRPRISDNARVFGDAWVFGNARVSGNACVFGDARVSGDAWVSGNARVSGDA